MTIGEKRQYRAGFSSEFNMEKWRLTAKEQDGDLWMENY